MAIKVADVRIRELRLYNMYDKMDRVCMNCGCRYGTHIRSMGRSRCNEFVGQAKGELATKFEDSGILATRDRGGLNERVYGKYKANTLPLSNPNNAFKLRKRRN